MISRHRVVMLLALCAATALAAVGLVTCGTVPAYAQHAGRGELGQRRPARSARRA
jgi:hypothetical protein